MVILHGGLLDENISIGLQTKGVQIYTSRAATRHLGKAKARHVLKVMTKVLSAMEAAPEGRESMSQRQLQTPIEM